MLALARVDKEDVAVEGSALANFAVVRIDEQTLDCERADMQRDILRQWRRPAVADEPGRGRDQNPASVRSPDRVRNRLEIGPPSSPFEVCGEQDIIETFSQLAGAPYDARANVIVEMLQLSGDRGREESRQLDEPYQVTIRRQVLDGRRKGPLIQRVHEVESRMAAGPFE